MGFDLRFLLLLAPAAAALIGQRRVRTEFGRWHDVPASVGLTGAQTASRLLSIFGTDGVSIERSDGKLSDHFDSGEHTLRLSPDVADGRSIASVAVTAHEAARRHGTAGTG